MLPEFDETKYFLGQLCKNGHDYNRTGKSLRYLKQNVCVACCRERYFKYSKSEKGRAKKQAYSNSDKNRLYKETRSRKEREETQRRRHERESNLLFIGDKHFLGKLCRNGHDWEGTELSLRYINDKKCVQCISERCAEYRERNNEYIKKRKKEHYRRNKDALLAKHKEYRESNAERWRESAKNYYLKHRDERRAKAKARYLLNAEKQRQKIADYYKTYPDARKVKTRIYRKRNRAALNEISRLNRGSRRSQHSVKIKVSELKIHYAKFDNRCAYCGSVEKLTLDHFIPMSKGGSHCLGNIVPACYTCNRRKQAQDPLEWYKTQSFYSRRQWLTILQLLGKTEESYNQIPLL